MLMLIIHPLIPLSALFLKEKKSQWGERDYWLNWKRNKKWSIKLSDQHSGFNRGIDWSVKTNVTFLKRRPESSLIWAKRGMMLLRYRSLRVAWSRLSLFTWVKRRFQQLTGDKTFCSFLQRKKKKIIIIHHRGERAAGSAETSCY